MDRNRSATEDQNGSAGGLVLLSGMIAQQTVYLHAHIANAAGLNGGQITTRGQAIPFGCALCYGTLAALGKRICLDAAQNGLKCG